MRGGSGTEGETKVKYMEDQCLDVHYESGFKGCREGLLRAAKRVRLVS